MELDSNLILSVLDSCCDSFTFPMMDNGYVYLAATRLSLYRSEEDWAMVIEVFGFSPRAGLPDTHIHTFASTLHDRDPAGRYKTRKAYENYLANFPHNDSRFIFPIESGPWQVQEYDEFLAEDATEVVVRGARSLIPSVDDYGQHGIELEQPPQVHVFELCRFLADVARESVLANTQERRVSVPPNLEQI